MDKIQEERRATKAICPCCNTTLIVAFQSIGKDLKCPKCSNIVVGEVVLRKSSDSPFNVKKGWMVSRKSVKSLSPIWFKSNEDAQSFMRFLRSRGIYDLETKEGKSHIDTKFHTVQGMIRAVLSQETLQRRADVLERQKLELENFEREEKHKTEKYLKEFLSPTHLTEMIDDFSQRSAQKAQEEVLVDIYRSIQSWTPTQKKRSA